MWSALKTTVLDVAGGCLGTHQILSARESREWRRPMGRPRSSWLQQFDRHLKDMGMGQASAWGMARQRHLEYRQKGRSDPLLWRMLPYLT